MKMDGVGRKTANLVLSTLYNKPYIAVDTHVERVCKRLNLVSKDANVLEVEQELYNIIPKDRLNKTHHQLVLFGRYYCKSIKPKCDTCKLKKYVKREKLTFLFYIYCSYLIISCIIISYFITNFKSFLFISSNLINYFII